MFVGTQSFKIKNKNYEKLNNKKKEIKQVSKKKKN